MKSRLIILGVICASIISSCVPARKVDELRAEKKRCIEEKDRLAVKNSELASQAIILNRQIDSLTLSVRALGHDTTVTGISLRKMMRQYDKIDKNYQELLEQNRMLRKGNESESKKLQYELQVKQEELQEYEDDLRTLKYELDKKKLDLQKMENELGMKDKRVNELEDLIKKKEEATKNLKQQIANALLAYEDKGLKVEQKDGKIYVSLEAKLLFAKGSTKVDSEGKSALRSLADILKNQEDIGILVEGHTDVDKMQSSCIKDNWDLSVLRATSVVRILTERGINPKQITAAGRGEYMPVDYGTTEEAKSHNRRIEIILTPNLEKIFKLLEN